MIVQYIDDQSGEHLLGPYNTERVPAVGEHIVIGGKERIIRRHTTQVDQGKDGKVRHITVCRVGDKRPPGRPAHGRKQVLG